MLHLPGAAARIVQQAGTSASFFVQTPAWKVCFLFCTMTLFLAVERDCMVSVCVCVCVCVPRLQNVVQLGFASHPFIHRSVDFLFNSRKQSFLNHPFALLHYRVY